MTNQEAFLAMTYFLESYYRRTGSDDVGALLGDMRLTGPEQTMDPAAWYDWLRAVETVQAEKP